MPGEMDGLAFIAAVLHQPLSRDTLREWLATSNVQATDRTDVLDARAPETPHPA